jgi:hypothetical protein
LLKDIIVHVAKANMYQKKIIEEFKNISDVETFRAETVPQLNTDKQNKFKSH